MAVIYRAIFVRLEQLPLSSKIIISYLAVVPKREASEFFCSCSSILVNITPQIPSEPGNQREKDPNVYRTFQQHYRYDHSLGRTLSN